MQHVAGTDRRGDGQVGREHLQRGVGLGEAVPGAVIGERLDVDVDFVLSNLVNADYLRVVVLTQYKSHSLDRHISLTWRMSTLLGNYVTPVPAQQRLGPRWFQGSAGADSQ